MRFKYAKQLNNLQDCPPADYTSKQLLAFRFVFDNIDHENNFLPILLKNPRRKLSDDAKCEGYGLSFFNSLENARNRYLKISRSYRNIHKGIGTHIARGTITKNDGIVSSINKQGHFTLHEFEHVCLKNGFSLIMKVYNGTN